MGAGAADLQAILKLRKDDILPKGFSIAEIGAQQLSNHALRDRVLMKEFADAFGAPVRDYGSAPPEARVAGETLPDDAPFSKEFWEGLGCTYMAVDVDTSPHSIALDLNFDDVPPAHKGRYDLVTNLGTTEHVANQIQAMKVIHDLTKVGGVMVHNLPTQGYANHGMLNYNPKFFWMLSRSCLYRWLDMRIIWDVGSSPISPDIVAEISRFSPENAERLKEHRLFDAGLIVVLQKVKDIPFVPPIDAHSSGVVGDERIRSRYWTVFGGERPSEKKRSGLGRLFGRRVSS